MRRSRNNFNICTPSMSISDIQAIDSVGDPPLPIPNREVKPDSADGTALSCGRVGHRHFFSERVSKENGDSLFFVYFHAVRLCC